MNLFFQSHVEPICIFNIIICVLLASLYVGSLYIWGKSEGRDHPSTVKKRCLSVFLMSFVSAVFVYVFADRDYFGHDVSFSSLLGLRLSGLLSSTILPLILTMILFLGPISLQYIDGVYNNFCDWKVWSYSITNVLWLRNHVIAPFFEEFTFRACMLPILVPCFGNRASVILCPFFFGVAHLHHLIEKLAYGAKFKAAVLQSLFQFAYTTVFGAYSTFLFLQTASSDILGFLGIADLYFVSIQGSEFRLYSTMQLAAQCQIVYGIGHVAAPFIVHAFCNFMGFPDFGQLFELEQPKKFVLMICFVLGLILWIVLLYPLTDPLIYYNSVYINQDLQ